MSATTLALHEIGNFAASVRRQLYPLRRRIDIALCENRIRHLPPSRTVRDIVRFALRERAIRAQQVPLEIMEFANLIVQSAPRTIIEIGTSRGGTLFILSRLAPPRSTIISIDMPGAGFGEAYTSRHVSLFKLFPTKGQLLHVVTADSHNHRTRKQVEDRKSVV